MAKRHAKFSEAAMALPPVVEEFINGVARPMAPKEQPAATNNTGPGALIKLFNSMTVAKTECFQYSPTTIETCLLGFLAMRSATLTVESENSDRLVSTQSACVVCGGGKQGEVVEDEEQTRHSECASSCGKRGVCREWKLSPNGFVRHANEVFTLFNVALETKD